MDDTQLWEQFKEEFAKGHSPDEEVSMGEVFQAYTAFVAHQRMIQIGLDTITERPQDFQPAPKPPLGPLKIALDDGRWECSKCHQIVELGHRC